MPLCVCCLCERVGRVCRKSRLMMVMITSTITSQNLMKKMWNEPFLFLSGCRLTLCRDRWGKFLFVNPSHESIIGLSKHSRNNANVCVICCEQKVILLRRMLSEMLLTKSVRDWYCLNGLLIRLFFLVSVCIYTIDATCYLLSLLSEFLLRA